MSGRRVRDRALYLRKKRVGVGHGSTTKFCMHEVFLLNVRFEHKKGRKDDREGKEKRVRGKKGWE